MNIYGKICTTDVLGAQVYSKVPFDIDLDTQESLNIC